MDQERLLDRFLAYVRIHSTADDTSETVPSSPGQTTMGNRLVEDLLAIGCADAERDEFGVVMATLPPSEGIGDAPTLAWCSHMDTSPEVSGENVAPCVIRDYPGGDIVLPADPSHVIRVAENPNLDSLVGKTLITADGTTLLGADDKSGIAVIMEAAQHLLENPDIAHGPIRICFTCDEEIGKGTDHLDLDRLGADVCYTLDGSGVGSIDIETFSADLALIEIHGRNIHPSIAKGRMVNAVRTAAALVGALPVEKASPESTDGREGFLHAYDLIGGVEKCSMKVLIRDFDDPGLQTQTERLRRAIRSAEEAFPGATCDLRIVKQYRNMREGLAKEPRAVEFAERALRAVGREPKRTIVRGGTDGSRLTEMGLPTPNLGSGQHTPHSLLEWACLEEMYDAARMLVELARQWADPDATH